MLNNLKYILDSWQCCFETIKISSNDLNEDGLLLRNDCIEDKASIAVPKHKFDGSYFRNSMHTKMIVLLLELMRTIYGKLFPICLLILIKPRLHILYAFRWLLKGLSRVLYKAHIP